MFSPVAVAATFTLILGTALGGMLAPRLANAQAASQPARVGLLMPGGAPGAPQRAFFERLRALGWIEGQNLVVETRRAGGKADVLPTLASELVERRVDVIVTVSTQAIQAARQATDKIPIVMAGGGDPVASGFVGSLARPGGNITGVSVLGQELGPKALSLLRELVPRAKRVDILANAANPANPIWQRSYADAAQALGLEIRFIEIRAPEDLDAAIAASQAHALLVVADPLLFLHARRIADAAVSRRLPLAGLGRSFVQAGAVMSYFIDYTDVFRLAAGYVDRILRGANPADLPVEQPTRYEMVFNLKTARALRLTIPQSLLLRADQTLD